MKISYNWLSEYLAKKVPPTKVAELLTMTIAEVETTEDLGEKLAGVVVGVIEKIDSHPNADRLKLVTVNVGAKTLRVVCGGTNVCVGMRVAFAHVGARVKWHGENWTTLESALIRGEKSEGMICSSVELELEDQYPPKAEREIIDLKDISAKTGTPLAQALGVDDVVFTIDNKSLTHRADLFSHIGIAREVAVAAGIAFQEPKIVKRKAPKGARLEPLTLRMEEKRFCRRNMNVIMSVKVGPSPDWLKRRLESVGLRSINNVVDVTNYVMLEYGQPHHAFDASKVADHTIVVRRARDGEQVTTLDGVQRKLTRDMLVIADPEKALDIAGVMGGENSEVQNDTTRIILEVSNLDPLIIRRTSQSLGLRTEGVVRWEKGLTTPLVEKGFWRAVELLQDIADAKILSRILDKHPVKERSTGITLRYDYLTRLIGQDIPADSVQRILTALECVVRKSHGEWKVTPPIFRQDLRSEEDCIEEVARIVGYNSITPKPLLATLELPSAQADLSAEFQMIQTCIELQCAEVMNNTFYGDEERAKTGMNMPHIELENSQSEELKYLRASLLPGLLSSIEKNIRTTRNLRFVERGHIFRAPNDEHVALAAVVTGDTDRVFFDAKGMVCDLCRRLGIDIAFQPYARNGNFSAEEAFVTQAKAVNIVVRGRPIGIVSIVPLSLARSFHTDQQIGFFHLFTAPLMAASSGARSFTRLPEFPNVYLDLAFEVPDTVAFESIERAIRNAGEPLLASYELFDVYEGAQVRDGCRSLAFHLVYRAPDRTLTLEEAARVHDTIIQSLKKHFTIIVRGETSRE